MHETPERPTEPDAAAAADMDEVRRRLHAYGEQRRTTERRGAAKWLLVLALLHLVLGVGLAPGHGDRAAAALRAVAEMRADELVTLRNGEQLTVGAYRASVENAVWRSLALSVGLGVVFAGLFVWARRSPVPALFAAIGVYIAATAVEAVFDPSSLSSGIIVKLLSFALLLHAIRSALQQSRADAAAPT